MNYQLTSDLLRLSRDYAKLPAEKRGQFRRILRDRGIPASRLPIVPLSMEGGRRPLSRMQQQLWFLSQLDPDSVAYNMPGTIELDGRVDTDALRRALEQLVERHEILRTRFGEQDGVPFQEVTAEADYGWTFTDLTDLDQAGQDSALQTLREAASRQPFDLARGPLVRADLVRLAVERHILILTLHHIVSDGWSTGILVREFHAFYAAALTGQPPELPALPLQYADYAAWQEEWLDEETLDRQVDYWRGQLANLPPALELPVDRSRRAGAPADGASFGFIVPAGLTAQLRALAGAEGATLYMVLLAAYQLLLARYSGQHDIVVGSPVAGRSQRELEDLVGVFVNTIALRCDLSDNPSGRDLLRRVRDTALGAFANQDTPFGALVAALQPDRDLAHHPVVQAFFTLQNTPGQALELPGLTMRWIEQDSVTAKFDLSLTVDEVGDSLRAVFEYPGELFDAGTIEGLLQSYLRLLCGLVDTPARPVLGLPLVDGGTALPVPQRYAFRSVTERVLEQCGRDLSAVAVVHEDQRLSYGDLESLSGGMAWALRRLGVGADVRVGLCMERSTGLVASLLGILRSGGAYVPLDPAYPEARLRDTIADAGLHCIVADRASAARLSGLLDGQRLVVLEDLAEAAEPFPDAAPHPLQLAYVIYTSGSTGRPKGVGISHDNVARLLDSTEGWFGFGPSDVWTLFHSYAFDFSVWEIFGALAYGGRLVVVPHWTARDTQAFHDLLRAEGVTVLNQTPSAFQPLMHLDIAADQPLTALRTVIFGGEKLEPSTLAPLIAARRDAAPALINMYGITETTVHATYRRLGAAEILPQGARSLIGESLPDLPVHVLDMALQPTPPNALGELCVGGAGLARGYLNRPGLTAERFVPNPYGEPGSRLYRSGDLARSLASGEPEYIGRLDHQVKLRGYRIELGEIEAGLRRCVGVKEAAVALKGSGEGKRLVGYVTGDVDPEAVRTALGKDLPEHMIPSAIMVLERLPLTSNGKLDRNALPEPVVTAAAGRVVAPRTPTEQRLRDLWSELLGVDGIGVEDHFFRLGAHSLTTVRLVSRIRDRLGREISPRMVFASPVLQDLAAEIDRAAPAASHRIPQRAPGVSVPLSHTQERLWFLWRMDPADTAYNLSGTLRLDGTVDADALRRAVDAVCRRHDVLRTRIRDIDGTPFQVTADDAGFGWAETDLADVEPVQQPATLDDLVRTASTAPFDLETGPCFRVHLIRLSDRASILVMALHHIIADGWSMPILEREIVAGYRAALGLETADLPALPLQFADVAAWERGRAEDDIFAAQLDYWRIRLADADTPLALPADRVRTGLRRGEGGRIGVTLPPALAESIRAAAQLHGTTPFVVLLAGFAVLLGRYAYSSTVRIGIPVSGRSRMETEGLIGCFINTLVAGIDLHQADSTRALLARVQEEVLRAQANGDVPFVRIVDELQPERDLTQTPFFQVMFNLQQQDEDTLAALPDLAITRLEGAGLAAQYDLSVQARIAGEVIRLTLVYATDIFDGSTVERLSGQYLEILEQLSSQDDHGIGTLSLGRGAALPAVERYAFRSVTERVLEQCRRDPSAVAVVHEDQRLSYGELEAWSGRMAWALKRLGVGADVRVGLCMERSTGLVASLLGILRAGGAYVPLDPAYPEARLRDTIADAGLHCIVADRASAARLSGLLDGQRVVVLEDLADGGGRFPDAVPHPLQLAYVIYTSGSTGRPKGVGISHDNVARLLDSTDGWFGFGPSDVWTLFHSYAFDFSVWEIFGALAYGGRLVVVPHWTARDTQAFHDLLRIEGVTVLNQTPSAFQPLMHLDIASDQPLTALRTVIFGGEKLEPSTLAPLIAVRGDKAPALINMYGITETTVHATYRRLGAAEILPQGARSLIGKSLSDLPVHVLDQALQLTPANALGELCVGGAGLARGYLNRPGLTAERFVPNPYGEPGSRLYRSGDLARSLASGEPEYIGRLDSQVKLRGYRIELGEIEAGLRGCLGVKEAAVALKGSGESKRLVGYVTGDVDPEAVHAALSHDLPEHMIPSAIMVLERLPLTPNGKLDRNALPEPEITASAIEVPRTETERVLCAVWAEVLSLPAVGITDNFFRIGGDSILSLRVIARAREQGIRVTPRQVFEHPTVERLAQVAEAVGSDEAAQAEITDHALALTPIQSWFFERYPEGLSHWNQSVLLRVKGELSEPALEGVLSWLVLRHDALRLRFDRTDGTWQQRVAVSEDTPLLRVTTLTGEAWQADLEAFGQSVQTSLDLDSGPLLRVGYARLPEQGEGRLLLAIHHLAVDGVSWRVLLSDLQRGYERALAGEAQPAGGPRTPWSHWAQALQAYGTSPEVQSESAWWRASLSDATGRLPVRSGGDRRLGSSREVTWRLEALQTRRLLQEVPQAYRTGVEDVLLAALSRVLSAWSGAPGVLVDLEGHGREGVVPDVDVSETVGWFTIRYPVWLAAETDAAAHLIAVKERLRSVPHRGLHWGLLPAASREGLPRSEVSFNYLGRFDGSLAEDGLFSFAREARGASMSPETALGHVLDINGIVAEDSLSLSWQYSPDVVSAAEVEDLVRRFDAEIRSLIAHCLAQAPGATASDFPLSGLTQAQFRALELNVSEIQDLYPATAVQQGMLFHSLMRPGEGVYVNQLHLSLPQALDATALQGAWQAMVARHDILRTGFEWRHGGEALQVVRHTAGLPFERHDWSDKSDYEGRLSAWRATDLARGFDPAVAPLIRVTVFDRPDGGSDLVWTGHHSLMDGWSTSQLLGEVGAAYEALRRGTAVPSVPGPSYRDYMSWLVRQGSGEVWWRSQLSEVDEPAGLLASLEGPVPDEAGSHRLEERLPEGLSDRLRSAAQHHAVTLNTLMQGAWSVLLWRTGNRPQVVFGATVSGRSPELPGSDRMLGLFINSLPVWVTLSPSEPVSHWLRGLQDRNSELRQYEHTPLSEIQRWAGQAGESLFDSLVVFENYPVDEAARAAEGGLAPTHAETVERTQYPLMLGIMPRDEMRLNWIWDGERLSSASMALLRRHYVEVLEQLASEEELVLGQLGIERETAAPRPLPAYGFRPVTARIAERAAAAPDRIAVTCAGESLSYGDLDVWSNRIGRALQRLGVTAEARVGLCLDRSAGMVASLLGVLKSGGAYVPLDPSYPEARLQDMVADAGLHGIVTDRASAAGLPGLLSGQRILVLEDLDETDGTALAQAVRHPSQLAYVIYTSGSTGKPKGVGVGHGALDRFLASMAQAPGLTSDDVWLSVTSISFDISALELYLPLVTGARVELARRETVRDGRALSALLQSSGATVLQATPMGWRGLLEGGWMGGHGLTALCGGEALPEDLAAALLQRGVRLWNMYGPTETTIWSGLSRVEAGQPIRLGEPIHDTTLQVLGAAGLAAPAGGLGELGIGGTNLARGYLNRPGLTAERFVPDPQGEPGSRLYRTGDLCRMRPDGTIQFLGRLDHQVKLRGYRIELGEIEAGLRRCLGVKEAAVALRGSGEAKRLVGYVTGEVDPDAIRAALGHDLPEHMIPSAILVLERLPMTPNGKLDRNALPEPEITASVIEAPRTETERVLCGIWAEVLSLPAVGITDNFFRIGGDSILSLRVIMRAREQGLRLTPRQLFEHPTVELLAPLAEATAADEETLEETVDRLSGLNQEDLAALGIDLETVQDIYPATPAQQGMLFHSLMRPGEGVYVNQLHLSLPQALDGTALRSAWDAVVARHDILRTGFEWRPAGDALQVVRHTASLPLELQDWSAHDASDEIGFEDRLSAWRREDLARGFDLSAAPLMRVTLFTRPDGGSDLVWTHHHVLMDGWSTSQLLGEVGAAYEALRRGAPVATPVVPPYRRYVSWLARQGNGEDWWRARLSEVDEPAGLLESLEPPLAGEPGTHRLDEQLPQDLNARLRSAAQRHAVTLNTLMQGAWSVLLSRYGNRRQVAFGTTVSGRPPELAGSDRMLGLFINSLPVWVRLDPGARVSEWLRGLQDRNSDLRQYEHTPLSEIQRWAGQAGESLFDSLVVFENYPIDDAMRAAASDLAPRHMATTGWTHYPLTLAIVPGADTTVNWGWDGERVSSASVAALRRHYLEVLEQLASAADLRLGDIVLDGAEVTPVRQGYAFRPVTERVLEQCGLNPSATAVVCDDQRLSYGGLADLSGRVASALRRLGVAADVRVGLCVERSVGMVASLLGIMRSGGAFMPLDPSYPEARLRDMIADAGLHCIVADRESAEGLSGLLAGQRLVVLEDLAEAAEPFVDAPLHPLQLAYVIYTSGSTGKPKGVAVSHGALSLHLDDFIPAFGYVGSDVALQFSTINFDAGSEQMLPVLVTGGRVVLRGPTMWTPEQLTAWMLAEQLTVADIPTSFWQEWLRVMPAAAPALRRVTVGGEFLPGDSLQAWAASPLGHVRLDNRYGPTETTMSSLYHRTGPSDASETIVPIGRPYPGRSAMVLDGDGAVVPAGGLGELCVGGDSVARGYLNRPGLTAERFVPDPHGAPGSRLYRTGDLCRMRADGTVLFLGRLDSQVKLRGYRIELGEIEAGLRGCAGVKEAAVALRGSGESKRLVGYVTGDVDSEAVRAVLGKDLPEHMIPSAIVVLERLPLTPNGKLDRNALPEPEITASAVEAPRTETERVLCAVWAEVLSLPAVGITDNFFRIGGDSILSLRVIARAREQGIRVTPRQVFEHPTVERLAQVAEAVGSDETVQAEITDRALALTPIQSWFFERYPEGLSHWNQSVLLRVKGELSEPALQGVLSWLVRRHDALRLRFDRTDGAWRQRVVSTEDASLLQVTTLTGEAWPSDLEAFGQSVQTSLELGSGPLLRVGYARLPEQGEGRLLLAIHHLAVDGVSWRVLLSDLQRGYKRALAGEAQPAGGPRTPWSHWAQALQAYGASPEVQSESAWWCASLSDATGRLPVRPGGDRRLGSSREVTWRLEASQTRRLLQEVPAAYRTGVEDVLLAALSRVLADWSGAPGVLVDLEGHGREGVVPDVDVSETVGWFTTRYPVWLSTETDAAAHLIGVKERLRSVPHRGLHWGLLPEAFRESLPQSEVSFNYLGRFDGSLAEDGLFGFAREARGASMSPDAMLGHVLDINGVVAEDSLSLSWRYSRDEISAEQVEDLVRRFDEEIRGLIEHCLAQAPGATASDFPLSGVTQAQFQALELDVSAIQDVYPATAVQQGMLFHSLMRPGEGVYVNQLHLSLPQALDAAAMQGAWQAMVARHDILRTGFEWRHGGEALQVVRHTAALPFERHDWSGEADYEGRLSAWRAADLARGFDPATAPLIRVTVFDRPDGGSDLVWTGHHSLMDGWSTSQLLGEVGSAYEALRRDAQVPAVPSPSYREYVSWLSAQGDGEAWWRRQLAAVDEPAGLLASLEAPVEVQPGSHRLDERLSADLSERLRQAAQRHEVTLNTLVQGAWSVLLWRYGNRPQVVFGATVSGRPAELAGSDRMLGLFINSLPVWVTLSPSDSVSHWLRGLQDRNSELRQYEHTSLSEIQRWAGQAGESLFDSLVVFENYPVDEAVRQAEDGFAPTHAEIVERTNYPVTLGVSPGARVALDWIWDGDRVPSASMDLLRRHYVEALEQLATEVELRLGDITLSGAEITPVQQHHAFRSVSDRILEQCGRNPDTEAVSCEGDSLSYGGLEAWSGRIGQRLQCLGVAADERVGLCVERSVALPAALLGILRSGGAYVPLDPSYPEGRLRDMIADAGLRRVVTDEASSQHLAGLLAGLEQVIVSAVPDEAALGWHEPAQPSQLAYVIYTSGSTGKPKGVGISHGALSTHLDDFIAVNGIQAADRVLQFSTINFDSAVDQLLPTLAQGARLVMRGPSLPEWSAFNRQLADAAVTVIDLPVAYWQQWLGSLPASLPALRLVTVGGEALPPDAVARWRSSGLGHIRLENTYGPTEATVTVSSHVTTAADADSQSVPIGRSWPGRSFQVLGPDGAIVPAGALGELCVGGASVARGYLNRPGLTAERFVPDPQGEPGSRLYRTGDLCRMRADGTVQFLGRLDAQVKLRGYRIELGEIEAALRGCQGVKDAAAAVRGSGESRRLVGYVTGDVDPEAIRTVLGQELPEHMIPSAILVLERLPLTPNGKLDRNALPEPEITASAIEAPRTETERILCAVWAEVLSLPAVGITDNFFRIGGDSISVMQAAGRLRRALGREISLKLLFETPVLASLAAALDASVSGPASAILPRPPEMTDLPLSQEQERLWFLWKLDPINPAYVIAGAFRLSGDLDATALHGALSDVVGRHESLRTRFVEIDGVGRQVIDPAARFGWAVLESTEDTVSEQVGQVAGRPFDLIGGPVLRACLLRVSATSHVVVLAMHHIVSDGLSVVILQRELVAAYEARRAGVPADLPALPIQYADYALWQRAWQDEAALGSQLAYWRGRLGTEHPVLRLPEVRARTGARSSEGGQVTMDVAPAAVATLRRLARAHETTLFVVLLAAWQAVLHRYSGQDDIRVGVPVAGRPRAETEGLIGFFLNTLVLRADFTPGMGFAALLDQMRARMIEAQANGDISFARVVEALQSERDLANTPLFQTVFNFEAASRSVSQPAGLEISSFEIDRMTSRFDLALNVGELEGGLRLSLVYATDIFDAATVERLCGHTVEVLEQLSAEEDRRLGALDLSGDGVVPVARTYDFRPVPMRVLEQCLAKPEVEAVVCEDQRLSYGGLADLSGRVAWALRRLGVGADARVGLCVERSVGMVASLLGVLRSGGAYVPLDPSHPEARLREMIGDAGLHCIVADRGSAERLSGLLADQRLVVLEDLVPEAEPFVAAAPQPQQLAYVIYTSGSTGKPKGVAVSHGSLHLHLEDFLGTYGISAEDTVLHSSTINFDVALHEILPALIRGGRVVMRGPAPWELDRMNAALAGEGVTFARIPTAYWQQWMRSLPPSLPKLRQVTVGGEGLPGDALGRWQRTHLSHVRLDNLYGPTETTVASLYHRTGPSDASETIVPIGRPYPGRSAMVLDGDGAVVPAGGLGELCVGGDSVARGYLNRPGLTAERFVPDPHGAPGSRLYRTGDLCRMRADGTVLFLGRLDQQVKLRGYRIELGEIEAGLRGCAGVKEAAVALKGSGESKRLVGYVTGDVDPEAIRSALARDLPEHMIPSAIMVLERLPLTPNGKLDRNALPEPEITASAMEAPRTETERVLCAVWAEVLSLPAVGITDNFFRIGGDSIKALKLVAVAKREGLPQLTLALLFANPLLSSLAAELDGRKDAAPRSVQPMNAEGAPALFCIHPSYGLAVEYGELAGVLAGSATLYGVQSPVIGDIGWRAASFTALAEEYVRSIRVIQPEGPYRLLGWSLGGWLAVEMAAVFEQQGQAVSFLGLVDTLAVAAPDQLDSGDDQEPTLAEARAHFAEVLDPEWLSRAGPALDDHFLHAVMTAYRHHNFLLKGYRLPVISAGVTTWWAEETGLHQPELMDWQPHTRGRVQDRGVLSAGHMDIIRDPALLQSVGALLAEEDADQAGEAA